jgi:uncharacterized protein (DUF2147 family)
MMAAGSIKPARSNSNIAKSRFLPPIGLASAILTTLVLATLPAFGQAAKPAAPVSGIFGQWLSDNGNLEIEIAQCGASICGTVVKVLANRSMSAGGEMQAADKRDPLGMKILIDFAPSGDGEWQGTIYNRENAKTYPCKITTEGQNQLVVRPYILLPLFGKDLVWRRVAAAEKKS